MLTTPRCEVRRIQAVSGAPGELFWTRGRGEEVRGALLSQWPHCDGPRRCTLHHFLASASRVFMEYTVGNFDLVLQFSVLHFQALHARA